MSERSGISPSTLSRLESGQRKYTLDLLLPLAAAYGLPLDELVGAPTTGDPRVHLRPVSVPGQDQTVLPLVRHYGGPHAHKHVLPTGTTTASRHGLHIHRGYSWVYVLHGRLCITAGTRQVVLAAGEAPEFDTRLPHAIGQRGRAAGGIPQSFRGPGGADARGDLVGTNARWRRHEVVI
ncbi:helix-turn-helix domain-containing protein [Streptomyces sp. NPDC088921]|uniref:helix-turn-helix domain-containing protein n=1 Tax=unclassified Streptomyces TaxID=2593676 RepID=UPI0034409247